MDKYLAMDIGGTFIKYSIMDDNADVLEDGAIPTEREPEVFRSQLLSVVEKYKNDVQGIAVCIGGFIDPVTGSNTDFSVMPAFRAFNLKEEFERASSLPVVIENDSNCALVGEMVKGAGKGCSDLLLLTIGTGIGGALAVDGKLYRGHHFKAGEAGFMRTEGVPAGATSVLVREVSEAINKQVDGIYIFEHLDDEVIAKVYEDWVYRLALVVGNVAVVFDPEAVLIGGGICRQQRFIDDLRRQVYKKYEHLEEYTDIRACETGNHAGRIGALSLLKQSL